MLSFYNPQFHRISEIQADSIARRYPDMRIASLRLHWAIPNREFACHNDPDARKGDLWGWVQKESGAKAFLLAVTDDGAEWCGHEAFFIAAPDITEPFHSKDLHEQFYGDVPIKEGKSLEGRSSFFDSSKAERLLGWKHEEIQVN